MSTAPETTESDPYRLPADATPHRYELTIAPDLDGAEFSGSVAIDLTVHRPTDALTCHAKELSIGEAWVVADGGQRIDAQPTLDPDTDRVTFALGTTLAPGPAALHVRFDGVLNDKLRGFYRSSYTDDAGADHTVAVTQFEATDARRAFPCWDEPAHKAVFAVTLEVPDDLLAISNGPELSREPAGDGRVRVRFADTMPMSTYLVAMVVGPLEATAAVDVDGVPLRIVHRPGQGDLAAFALEVGAFALRYFADYYGIVYPGDKMDMVAVPDFAFGAMENLGCVIYRETLLLLDPDSATQAEKMAVVDVIAHELAHMWFGDLVTMRWWNGIWLNEAFATFMEMKCSSAFRPEWERWMHFGRERTTAFDTDALAATRPIEFPVHSPADAEGMFDVLTYQKGSAVVRMLEQYLGEDAFRDGIRRYLQTHQFGNTETGDLWDALEAETGEPVRAMMDSWIFQGGFPLVTVEPVGDGIGLEQQPFAYLPTGDDPDPQRWHIPIVARFGSQQTGVLLDGASTTCATDGGPVMVNAGGHGFYRTLYSREQYESLFDQLPSLEPLERYTILDDGLALCLRGDVASGTLTLQIKRLVAMGEDDLSIWQLGAEVLRTLDRAVVDSDRDAFRAWQRETLRPLWERLGPEAKPDESDLRRALRGVVLAALGTADDPEAMALAQEVFDRTTADPSSVEPGLASGALTVVAQHADGSRFDAIIDRFRHGRTPQEQVRFLYAGASVHDGALFGQYLDLLAGNEVRTQNLAFAYRAALRNQQHGSLAWSRVAERWDDLMSRLPSNSAHRLVEGIVVVDDPDAAASIEAFLHDHPMPQATRLVAQHIERMHVSVALRARIGDRIVAELP